MRALLLTAALLGMMALSPSVHAENADTDVTDTDLAIQFSPAVFAGKEDRGLSLGGELLVRHGYLTAGVVAEFGGTLYSLGHSHKGVFGAAGGGVHWKYFRTNAVLLLGATAYTNSQGEVPENMESGTVATIGGRTSVLFVVPFGDTGTSMTLGPVAEYVFDSKTESVEIDDRMHGEQGNAVVGDNRWRLGLALGLIFGL